MGKPRVSFPVLEDFVSKAGLALHKVLAGDAAANKNALAALIGMDDAGNLQYPRVDSARQLVISNQTSLLAYLNKAGLVSGGGLTAHTVASITLQTDHVYESLAWVVGCSRFTYFTIVHNDDGTPTTLVEGIFVGEGKMSADGVLKDFTFTSGSSGTQELLLQAINLDIASDTAGTIVTKEVQ